MASVRLIVELEGDEQIAGWLERTDGPRERFDGLLELILAFDRARAREQPGSQPAERSVSQDR